MPEVNGKRYRTFGQGYAAEKNKGKDDSKAAPEVKQTEEDHEGSEKTGYGDEMMVKHVGGGKFQTISKHEDGHKSKEEHESPEALHEHMQKHFGYEGSREDNEEDSEGEMSSEEGDGMDALRSLLG